MSTDVMLAMTPARILVVDDDPRNRRLLDAMLSPDGYLVTEASTGEECLEILATEGSDLVLLDVMMPGIGGIETCHRLRQRPEFAFLPVIFITALDDRNSRVQGKAVGADDFLTKPVDETELLVRVRNLILVTRYRERLERQNFKLEDLVRARTTELRRAVARLELAEKALRQSHETTIQRLARAAEFRDDATAHHTIRMSRYCELIARKLGLDRQRAELIRTASPMHDVGKIGIPDHILFKPGALSAEEFAIVRQHPEIGYRILAGSDSPLLDLAALIALTHHERYDGSGYPQQLRGDEIPLEGRIAAIADVWDALTTDRVYKPAYPLEESISILRRGRGTHFDPVLLDLFLESFDAVQHIMLTHADGLQPM
jgi:putative two-component system response regulator